jgi:DNA polymerase-4
MSKEITRKIIHVDMDAFYASVEQRDRPELRGKPVVVGGSPEGRGVVAAASYEARRFGVKSAMSARRAIRLCPQAVFVRPDFDKYSAVSKQIREIFHSVTDLVEPLSLDEAYLDVTENKLGVPLARDVARHLKDRIRAELNLTASAGVGPNKFIAKVASDLRKPDGLVVIPPEKVMAFVETLPVERLWGVGPVTSKRLQELGWLTAGDLRRAGEEALVRELGKFGAFLHELSNGRDDRPVEVGWERKSRGTEETFSKDVLDLDTLLGELHTQVESVAEDLREAESLARTVTIKVRYSDFTTITRSRTLWAPTDKARHFEKAARELLLHHTDAGSRPVRLLGFSLSGLVNPEDPVQLWLDVEL